MLAQVTISSTTLHDWGILLAAVSGLAATGLGILNHFGVREVKASNAEIHLLVNDRLDKALVHITALEAKAAGVPLDQQRAETYLRSTPAVVAETEPKP